MASPSLIFEHFKNKLHIINCIFKLPRKIMYNGHPFYYETLKTFEAMSQNLSLDLEDILSLPIWFNRILKSQFDPELSQAGLNYIKDLFPENQPLENFNGLGLRNIKIRKLRTLINRVPQVWLLNILQMPVKYTAVIPHIMINLQGQRQGLGVISSDKVYDKIIEIKIKPPAGLRRWRDQLNLSESDILNGFTHAHLASKSSFDRTFQYKIMTQILPTNQYLARYRVRDTDICEKCHI